MVAHARAVLSTGPTDAEAILQLPCPSPGESSMLNNAATAAQVGNHTLHSAYRKTA